MEANALYTSKDIRPHPGAPALLCWVSLLAATGGRFCPVSLLRSPRTCRSNSLPRRSHTRRCCSCGRSNRPRRRLRPIFNKKIKRGTIGRRCDGTRAKRVPRKGWPQPGFDH